MRIAREEIFGPVVSIIPFDTEEEALRLANATPYGLSGSIWSRDIGKALRAAKALQAGVISVNSNARSTPRRRSAATRCRASGASSGCRRSTSTPRRRTSSSTSTLRVTAAAEAAEPIRSVSRAITARQLDGRARRPPSQSRSAQCVVLNAMPGHGMSSGAKATISVASGVGAAVAADDPRLERDRHDAASSRV